MFKPRRIPGRSRFAAFFDAPTPDRSLYPVAHKLQKWTGGEGWIGPGTFTWTYPKLRKATLRPSYR